MSENESDNRNMSENHGENKTMSGSVEGDQHEEHHNSVFTPTQQDIQNIDQAKANQTIAAEVNVGTNQSTTTIDNNVSVQTTSNTPDSLNVNVSAPSQTGPKVIVFNLNATTVNLQNLNNLGVMYDGKLIQPAPNMDVILHAKSTDNPSFAIVVTQSGIQVLVLIPHFSTHSITIMNMSQVIAPSVPEFPFAAIVLVISTFSIVLISRMKQYHVSNFFSC
jgi:predicted secreted protein with PEFG-CTERM motif